MDTTTMPPKLRYVGTINLQCKGNIDAMVELNSLIVGRVGLEIAFLTSLSSALVGLLNHYKETESLLVHFYGNSTSGKTTALQLGASLWGCPSMGSGILSTWNTTDNALLGKLSGNYGVVLCLDESSVLRRDYSTLIYSISQNTNKQRLNKDSHLMPAKKFCTSILSSGENSLLASSNQNLGLRCRLLEFFDCPLTDNAEHSNQIKTFISNNYGITGHQFVKILSLLSVPDLIATLDKWQNQVLAKMKPLSEISERLSAKYAILLTCAEIAQQKLDFKINIDNLVDFFALHHKSLSIETHLGQRAYESILSWIAKNRNRLAFSPDHTSTTQIDGAFLDGGMVAILKSSFETILYDAGFTDVNVVAKALKQMDILKPESINKITARVVINHVKVPCYRLKIKDLPSSLLLASELELPSNDEIDFD